MNGFETDTRAGGYPPSTKTEFADYLPAQMQTTNYKTRYGLFSAKSREDISTYFGENGLLKTGKTGALLITQAGNWERWRKH